jgi:biopolymer transport protein ExbB/TolQ
MNENLFYIIEFVVTLVVLSLQFNFFFQTKKKFDEMNLIFPENSLESDFIIKKDINGTEVELIKDDVTFFGSIFKEMLFSINRYLIKNKGAVDFSIIKSIVERSMQAKENEVSSTVSLPLYIGLMGTFIGVILGLLKIAFFGGVSDENINAFIGGIFIAMVASLCGLVLTVINNSGNFKKAKTISDDRKNKFFNFLQVELLPHLGSSLYDALDRLKVNINNFNEKFSNNVKMFDTNFTSNIYHLKQSVESIADNINPIIENTNSQKEFLKELRGIGYNRMAEANIKVFTLMKDAGPNFVKFIDKQKELNESIEKTADFVNTIRSVMDRIKTFEESINKLGDRIDNADYMSSDLLKKVERKMSELDNQFEILKQHSQTSNSDIYNFFERESIKIGKLVAHIENEIERVLDFNIDNNPFQKLTLLDKLSQLQNLEIIVKDNLESKAQTEDIYKEIIGTRKSLETVNEYLSSIDNTLIEINEGGGSEPIETEEDDESNVSFFGKLFGSNGKHRRKE